LPGSRANPTSGGKGGHLLVSLAAAALSLTLARVSFAGSPAVAQDRGRVGARTTPAAEVPPPAEATAADVLKAVRSARGDVVVVNVWATWCDPCRHEFPALLRVRREFAPSGLRLILVSADFADQRPKIVQFLAQQGVGFQTFLKAENDMSFINALDPAWSGALPATFVYDRSGKLHDFWEGEATYEAIAGKVRALLGREARQGTPRGGPR